MRESQVVVVDVREQHGVDLAEPRIVRTADRESGIVEDARPVRILENERAIEGTEFAVMASQRRDFDIGRSGGHRRHAECQDCHHDGLAFHCFLLRSR
jgi:hypothetical protein